MPRLHEPSTRSDLERRIQALRSDSRGRWGQMTVDQMLWHCNQAMALSLGDVTLGPGSPPMPPWLLKFIVLRLPWFKGAPTHPDFVAKANYDFDGERDRLLRQIQAVAARPLDGPWPHHPAFGPMTGHEVSRLLAKHLDHHLRQFGN